MQILKILKEIYPRLPEYGFVLDDCYVKLPLMFISREGTKQQLMRSGAE